MDIATITQLISSMGFPIAVCLVAFWFINKLTTENREEINRLSGEYKAEIDKLSDVVNNNTLVIQKLIDKLD